MLQTQNQTLISQAHCLPPQCGQNLESEYSFVCYQDFIGLKVLWECKTLLRSFLGPQFPRQLSPCNCNHDSWWPINVRDSNPWHCMLPSQKKNFGKISSTELEELEYMCFYINFAWDWLIIRKSCMADVVGASFAGHFYVHFTIAWLY